MAKRLNYQIGITADISQFQTQMNRVFESLTKVGTSSQVTKELQRASSAALELANNLSKAYNQDTGKLDLRIFEDNLKRSGQTLSSYYDQLVRIGPDGQQAFLQVVSAVTQAELPIKRTSKLLDQLWVTMKNTMRWQLTSSALNSFTGALQTAYGYSKSLNASLNNIRIVSDKSADDMKEFAEYANKAAKALSTTTTDYTDASLIYYQQGLTDEEVLARTETTVKMANVAGQTAETVSDQMTAVWNNFYDGSKSIEYYADVMVKLGAATASSADEIAQGLEKFAAVGNTVGLSYEYATSALATITSNTRQSADVVGTALKTIFARIQDLKLGETLEDGTTLGTYSKALEAVGINVLDANGQLVKMDTILDELGEKWGSLSNAQQVALAQAIAGVRQYNQIVSLMDNWDSGDADSMQANLEYTREAEGELQRQADIYAESWEAARDRVTAAAEDIYDSLVNPDFYIAADDVLTPLLSGIADVIDAAGGLSGVLTIAGTAMMSLYGDKIAQGMRDMVSNLGFMVGYEQVKTRLLQQQAAGLIDEIAGQDQAYQIESQLMNLRQQANIELDNLNEYQKKILQSDIDDLTILKQQVDTLKQRGQAIESSINNNVRQVTNSVDGQQAATLNAMSTTEQADIDYINNIFTQFQRNNNQITTQRTAVQALAEEYREVSKELGRINVIQQSFDSNGQKISQTRKDVRAMGTDFEETGKKIDLFTSNISKTDRVTIFENSIEELSERLTLLRNEIENRGGNVGFLQDIGDSVETMEDNFAGAGLAQQAFKEKCEQTSKAIEQQGYRIQTTADKIVQVGQLIGQTAMAISALQNLGRVFTDEDMTAGERLISIFTSLSMIIPLVGNATKGLTASLTAQNAVEEIQAVLAGEKQLSEIKNIILRKAAASAVKQQTDTSNTHTAALTIENIAQKAVNGSLLIFLGYAALALVGVAALTAIIYALVNAYNADADAAKEAATGVEELTKNYEDAKTAASELKDTISNWNDAVAGLKDLEQDTKEFEKALKSANDQAKDLIETYGLWNDYTYDRNGAIKFNNGVLENLQAQADQRERDAESSLYAGKIYSNNANIKSQTTNTRRDIGSIVGTGTYDEYGNEYKRQLTNDEINSAIGLLKSKDENSEPISNEQLIQELQDLIPGLSLSVSGLEDFRSSLESLSSSMDEAKEANEYYAKELLKNNLEETRGEQIGAIADGNKGLEQQLLETYAAREAQVLEEQDKALSELTVDESKYKNNNAVKNYTGWDVDDDEALARLYAEKVLGRDDVDELSYKGGNNKGNLQTASGELVFDESMSDDYMRKMLAYAYAQEELMASLAESSENFDQEAYEDSLKKLVNGANTLGETFGNADFASAILNSLAEGGESIDLSSLFTTLSPDDIAQLTGISQEELYAALGLSEQDLATLGIDNAETWYNSFINSLDQYDESEYWDRINKAASSGEKSARTLIESVQSGDVDYENIAENEDYTNLLKQLDAIVHEYPELEAAQIELSKTWEVGTQKFAEALEQVQDKLAEIKLNDLVEDAADAKQEFEDFLGDDWKVAIEADPDGFNSAIDKILDAEYAIDIEIHSQAEQEFESISNAMSNIQNQASKIGENFVVSANDIRELNNIFPGIIENMQAVGDGSVQLNQQVVENAIAAAKGEVAADAEATITKLENQATLLRSKQQVYQQMATAAAVLAGAETESAMTSDEAQAALSAGLSELEQLNSNAATTVKTENQQITADSSNKNGETVAENWNLAFSSAAQSSAEFARTAIANMKAVTDENAGAVTTGNFKVNYSGASGVSEEAATLQETQDVLDAPESVTAEKWAELAAKYQNLADSTGAAANDIEGMIAQIGASTTELDGLLTNISNGNGPGGGSNGKTLDKEDLKTLDEVEDRYHNINRQLERQLDLLDDIDNATDRAYGKDKLAKFQEGIKALEKEQELLNKKLSEAKDVYLPQDIAAVKQYFSNAQIDSNGEITNYEELLRLNMEMYNAEVEKYNLAVAGKTLTDEEAEALKDQLETAKTLYDIRLAALEQYESTLDTIRDITDQIEENARSIADQKLEEIKYKLEIVIDIKSMYDSLRDLEKEIAESFGDALTHGLKSAYLSAEGAKAEAALLPNYRSEYEELKALYESTTDDADRQAIMEEIQDLQGKIIDSASALVEWANSIEDIVPDAVDAASERFAAFTDQLDHNTSVLDTIKELYTLQEVTYKTMDGFNRLQKVSQEKLEAQVASAVLQKGWYEEAQSHLAEAQARLDSLNDDETDPRYDTYKKARDAYLEEFNEAQEAYLTSAKEAMETAKDMYTQQIEQAVYEFGQAISNGVGLDLLQEQYDHYIEENERYLDTVNEAYKVASWYNKLQKDIDESTTSVQTQRLKALQEEIDARRENNTLSEYDLEILEAKYNVLQAQMALEDAQNAKNNLQLVRDSQGNWNYQYTADQDKIADAEQGLLDAQNDWYNIAKQQVTDITGEIVAMWKECQDKVKEIYEDDNLTYEEKLAAAEEVQKYYSEKAKYLEEEKNIAIKDMNEAGSEALISIAQTTGEETANLVGEFTNTYADKLGEMTQTNIDFEERLNELLNQANQDFLNYQDTVDNVAQETGTTLNDLAEETDKVSEATDKLRECGEEAASSLWDQVDAAQNASDEYLDLADSIWEAVYAMQALAAEQANYAASQAGVSSSTGELGYDPNADYSALMGTVDIDSDEYNLYAKWRDQKISDGYDGAGANVSTERVDAFYKKGYSLSNLGYNYFTEIPEEEWKKLVGFSTGGYTGTFDDAKLAFLHEKELVLNQEDTANILAAVHAVRDFGPNLLESIEKALDNNTIAAMALMGAKLTTSMVAPQSDVLEQIVHIDKVEFPNVTSRTEIEEAFISLTNDAAQWARRRT